MVDQTATSEDSQSSGQSRGGARQTPSESSPPAPDVSTPSAGSGTMETHPFMRVKEARAVLQVMSPVCDGFSTGLQRFLKLDLRSHLVLSGVGDTDDDHGDHDRDENEIRIRRSEVFEELKKGASFLALASAACESLANDVSTGALLGPDLGRQAASTKAAETPPKQDAPSIISSNKIPPVVDLDSDSESDVELISENASAVARTPAKLQVETPQTQAAKIVPGSALFHAPGAQQTERRERIQGTRKRLCSATDGGDPSPPGQSKRLKAAGLEVSSRLTPGPSGIAVAPPPEVRTMSKTLGHPDIQENVCRPQPAKILGPPAPSLENISAGASTSKETIHDLGGVFSNQNRDGPGLSVRNKPLAIGIASVASGGSRQKEGGSDVSCKERKSSDFDNRQPLLSAPPAFPTAQPQAKQIKVESSPVPVAVTTTCSANKPSPSRPIAEDAGVSKGDESSSTWKEQASSTPKPAQPVRILGAGETMAPILTNDEAAGSPNYHESVDDPELFDDNVDLDDDDVQFICSSHVLKPVSDFGSVAARFRLLRARVSAARTPAEAEEVRCDVNACRLQLASSPDVKFPPLQGAALFLCFLADPRRDCCAGGDETLNRKRAQVVRHMVSVLGAKLNLSAWTRSSWNELAGLVGDEDLVELIFFVVAACGVFHRQRFLWDHRELKESPAAPIHAVTDAMEAHLRKKYAGANTAKTQAKIKDLQKSWNLLLLGSNWKKMSSLKAEAQASIQKEASDLLAFTATKYRHHLAQAHGWNNPSSDSLFCPWQLQLPTEVIDVSNDSTYKAIFDWSGGRRPIVKTELPAVEDDLTHGHHQQESAGPPAAIENYGRCEGPSGPAHRSEGHAQLHTPQQKPTSSKIMGIGAINSGQVSLGVSRPVKTYERRQKPVNVKATSILAEENKCRELASNKEPAPACSNTELAPSSMGNDLYRPGARPSASSNPVPDIADVNWTVTLSAPIPSNNAGGFSEQAIPHPLRNAGLGGVHCPPVPSSSSVPDQQVTGGQQTSYFSNMISCMLSQPKGASQKPAAVVRRPAAPRNPNNPGGQHARPDARRAQGRPAGKDLAQVASYRPPPTLRLLQRKPQAPVIPQGVKTAPYRPPPTLRPLHPKPQPPPVPQGSTLVVSRCVAPTMAAVPPPPGGNSSAWAATPSLQAQQAHHQPLEKAGVQPSPFPPPLLMDTPPASPQDIQVGPSQQFVPQNIATMARQESGRSTGAVASNPVTGAQESSSAANVRPAGNSKPTTDGGFFFCCATNCNQPANLFCECLLVFYCGRARCMEHWEAHATECTGARDTE